MHHSTATRILFTFIISLMFSNENLAEKQTKFHKFCKAEKFFSLEICNCSMQNLKNSRKASGASWINLSLADKLLPVVLGLNKYPNYKCYS